MERIAVAAIELDKPFQRLQTAGQTRAQVVQQTADYLVLAGVQHRDANTLEKREGLLAFIGLQQGLHHFLRGPEILDVGIENARGQGRSLLPVRVLEIKIEKQLGLFAALVQIGHLLERFRGLNGLALRRIDARASLAIRLFRAMALVRKPSSTNSYARRSK